MTDENQFDEVEGLTPTPEHEGEPHKVAAISDASLASALEMAEAEEKAATEPRQELPTLEDESVDVPKPNPNVIVKDRATVLADADGNAKFLVLPMDSPEHLAKLAHRLHLDEFDPEDKSVVEKWASEHTPFEQRAAGILSEMVSTIGESPCQYREGSSWRQAIPIPGKPGEALRAGIPSVKESGTGLSAAQRSGATTIVQVPLWGSGFWVAIRSPKLSKWMELMERLSAQKISLGRTTTGNIFSNLEVYTNQYLIDFVIEHIYSVSLPNKSPEMIKRLLLVTDIPQLLWGMALSMYPKGYRISQPCLSSPNTCQHVEHALLNLGKISFTDESMLSPEQITHMATKRVSIMTEDDVLRYQKQFSFKGAVIELDGGVRLRLAVPNIQTHVEVGVTWVESIVTSMKSAFTVSLNDKARANYMERQVRATMLRQFSHWVEAIIEPNGNGNGEDIAIESREQIDDALEDYCVDVDLLDKIGSAIMTFQDNAVLSFIGLPNEPCRKCAKPVDEEYLEHPSLIPLNMVELFFILNSQRAV